MSGETESGQERFPQHADGQSSSSSPSSTDAATLVHNEYPRGGESGAPVDSKPQRQATLPWYQEHGKSIHLPLRPFPLWRQAGPMLTARQGVPIDQDPAKHEENELDFEKHHKKYLWSRIRHSIRDPLAEFLGCFILIIFGDGSVAQVVLSSNPDLPKGSQNKGAYQSISWG